MADAELFRRLAELDGSVAFVLALPARRFVYLSPQAEGLLGYAQAALEADGAALDLLCSARPELECEWRCPDGSVRPLRILAEHAAGQIIGLVRDNSAQRDMLLAQKRFASMLNHEFRTPLATIDGAVQRLEATGQQHDAPTRDRYRKIQNAVDRLIGMLDDYLSPDRLALTGHKPRAAGVAPAALMEEAATLARAAGRDVDVMLGPLPASVRGDPAAPRLALKLLIENALQFAPAPARLQLSGSSDSKGLELLVSDNGPGLPAAELPDIFQKGFRGSNASGMPGKGIGLYMARSVLEAQGGSLTVRLRPEGGLSFRIWLPAG